MKILCAPADFDFDRFNVDCEVVLYEYSQQGTRGSIGVPVLREIAKQKLVPAPRGWDFLSIALSVMAADLAGHRDRSPDGWTREFDLHIAVTEPTFWSSQAKPLQDLLQFLTTDRWQLTFLGGSKIPTADAKPVRPQEDSVVLLSGGLDSFIGVVDLVKSGQKPFAVSQSVRGDAEKQRQLASLIGGGLRHLQLNHNAVLPNPENPPSQRARSIVFFAYGVLAATTLAKYQAGQETVLNVCENGFITVNPPLTGARLGSLSTRTSHPVVLALLQRVLNAADLRVRIDNPYRHRTKGEMLASCKDQALMQEYAYQTTSCGRFKRFGYKHCGRCIPCLIRRAAFHSWGIPDKTEYVYADLSIDEHEHAKFDDVRAAAMAVEEVKQTGIDGWLGATFSSPLITEAPASKDVVRRGLMEVDGFLQQHSVQ